MHRFCLEKLTNTQKIGPSSRGERNSHIRPPSSGAHDSHRAPLDRRSMLLMPAALNLIGTDSSFANTVDKRAGQIAKDYNVYAENYDDLDGGSAAEALGFVEQRRTLLAQARGDVLETAVGTGLSLSFYQPGSIKSFTGLDISSGMLSKAQGKARALRGPFDGAKFVNGDVAEMPFEDGSFDTVVDTFSCCVFPRPQEAVKEMARVLRKGGQLLLLEHSRSSNPLLGAYQDLTADAVAQMGGKGCVYNQDVEGFVRAAGLKVRAAEYSLGGLIVMLRAEKV